MFLYYYIKGENHLLQTTSSPDLTSVPAFFTSKNNLYLIFQPLTWTFFFFFYTISDVKSVSEIAGVTFNNQELAADSLQLLVWRTQR